MNGDKLSKEFFVMTNERIKMKEAILRILKMINWSEYEKFGLTVRRRDSNSVTFVTYEVSMLDGDEIVEIRNFIVKEIPSLGQQCMKNPIYDFLLYSNIVSDEILKKNLSEEYGINISIDSYEAQITITKEELSML